MPQHLGIVVNGMSFSIAAHVESLDWGQQAVMSFRWQYYLRLGTEGG